MSFNNFNFATLALRTKLSLAHRPNNGDVRMTATSLKDSKSGDGMKNAFTSVRTGVPGGQLSAPA